MRELWKEIKYIFNQNKPMISLILVLELLEAVIVVINPLILGYCIDDLREKRYKWLIVFLFVEFLFVVITALNLYFDSKVYGEIIKNERHSFYKEAIKSKKVDYSKISSRLDLKDDISNSLSEDFPNIIFNVCEIFYILFFLYINETVPLFLFAVAISLLAISIPHCFRKNITNLTETYKTLDEKRTEIIETGINRKYQRFLNKILKIDISITKNNIKIMWCEKTLGIILLAITFIFMT